MIRRYPPLQMGAIFTFYAFAVSWLCWLPVVASDHKLAYVPAGARELLIILGTFGPLLAAITIVVRTGGGRGLALFIGQAFRWRAGPQWYAAALLGPFAIRLAVLGVHALKGGAVPNLLNPSVWLAMPATFVAVLLIGGPIGEEFGWRGFLLQRVQPRFGLLGASLVIGVVASLWHLPLFFITGTAQSHLPYVLFALRTIALSTISTWLYNGTRRSLLFVLLFHASLNTGPNTVTIEETEGTLGPFVSGTILYVGWAFFLFLLGYLHGRGDRRQQEEPASPTLAA